MNEYSGRWFQTFLKTVPDHQTDQEVSFLVGQLPLSAFGLLMDLCCGSGRHSIRLARLGYRVVAVDREPTVVRIAEGRHGNNPAYVVADMTRLPTVEGGFDGVLLLWQSFGYLSPAGNRHLLESLASQLREGGRLILDLYHREFFQRHQGVREIHRNGRRIVEEKVLDRRRLSVSLTYDDGSLDRFDWELFTPSDLTELADGCGLRARRICCRFDEGLPPSPAIPRFQAVLERM